MFRNAFAALKRIALAGLLLSGGTLFSSCGMADLKDSMIAGTMDFVQAYTTATLESLIPPVK